MTDVTIGSIETDMNLLPQGVGEGKAKFERHGEALKPLRQGRKTPDCRNHFRDPVIDIRIAGAAPYLDQGDLAVIEDEKFDDDHPAPTTHIDGRQQAVM